jgi:Fe-S cluster assembly protein SufD
VNVTGWSWFETPRSGRPWLRRLREAARERFEELGFPTTHVEAWKYTSVAPIARTAFQPAPEVPAGAIAEKLARAPLADLDAPRIVVVNGRFAAEVSTAFSLLEGVQVGSLAGAVEAEPEALQPYLGSQARYDQHAFVALNTACLADGVVVRIPTGRVLEVPLYLLHVTAADGQPTAWHPRTLVLAGRDSQARIIEGYLGLNGGVSFSNAVTEAVLDEGAVLDYTKLEAEGERAFHFGALHVRQARASSFASHSISLGGRLVRNEIGVVLAGEGAEATLNGLYLAGGERHVDNYTTLDHAQPHCPSRELYKGILDGKAHAVFHGRIIVRQEAQKTDAIQRNKNLLLSGDAVIDTKPQLEIYADDVRCTHGATVGQVDPEAVFYLRSRGIAREEARSLLTFAFASEMIDRLPVEALRDRLREAVRARLNPARRL